MAGRRTELSRVMSEDWEDWGDVSCRAAVHETSTTVVQIDRVQCSPFGRAPDGDMFVFLSDTGGSAIAIRCRRYLRRRVPGQIHHPSQDPRPDTPRRASGISRRACSGSSRRGVNANQQRQKVMMEVGRCRWGRLLNRTWRRDRRRNHPAVSSGALARDVSKFDSDRDRDSRTVSVPSLWCLQNVRTGPVIEV
jgi:hypothetical protein